MTAQSWQSLRTKKYQFSLRLYLFLNAVSALFAVVWPVYQSSNPPLAGMVILLLSTALLAWHGKYGHKRIHLAIVALLFGGLWAAHIILKYYALIRADYSFLLVALLSVLFIGSISFASNITAFTLHALPSVLACLWLNGSSHGLQIVLFMLLPMTGIAIQHVIQKRYDNFAQQLMLTLQAEKETLNDLSMLDPLTGLYNRRGLHQRLETLLALDALDRYVLLIDIDHFKAYNDHYGHAMGDQALIRVSAAIRDAVRSRDVVARFGGEEFMVLLTAADPQQARIAAERIRQSVYDLSIPHQFNQNVATNVTISIGIAPLVERDVAGAISNADKALYQAKHRGRNHILASGEPHTA